MKYFINFFTLTLFCLSGLSLHAMEEEPIERGLIVKAPMPKTVTFKTFDGQITLEATRVKRLKTIKHLMQDCPSETNFEVDIPTFYDPHLKTPTIESIKTLITFIENPTMSCKLDQTQLNSVFNAADFLEAPKSIRHKLARKLIPLLMKTGDPSILDNLPYSIQKICLSQTLAQKNTNSPEPPIDWLPRVCSSIFPINLSNKNLESLDGIEILKNRATKYLDISNNKLEKLNLKKIMHTFPCIRFINANNNKIKKLSKKDITAISSNLHIKLRNNLISCAEQANYFFMTPNKAVIDLRNNPRLTSKTLHNLNSSLFQRSSAQIILSDASNSIHKHPALMAGIWLEITILYVSYICYKLAGTVDPKHTLDAFALIGSLPILLAIAIHRIAHYKFKPSIIKLDPDISYLALKAKEKRSSPLTN